MKPTPQNDAAFAYKEGAPHDMMRVTAIVDRDFTAYLFHIASKRRKRHGVTAMHFGWTFVAGGVGMTPDGRFVHLVSSTDGEVVEGHHITLKEVDALLRAAVAANNMCNERILNVPLRKPEGGGAHGSR